MGRHPSAFRQTGRIFLCALDEHMVNDGYVGWLNDPDTSKSIVAGNFPQSRKTVKQFVNSMNSPSSVSFAICLQETGTHIGNIALRHIDWISRHAEVGILIGNKQAQGNGYASEALQLLMEYAFKTLRLNRLWTGSTNPKAVKLFTCAGWTYEGTWRRHALIGGELKDNILMGILAEEF